MNEEDKIISKGCTFSLLGCAGTIIVLAVAVAIAVKLFKLIAS